MTEDFGLFRTLLFPTDFSRYEQRVFECVSDLRNTGEIVLLNVVDSRMHLSLGTEILTDRAQAEFKRLEELNAKRGLPSRSVILSRRV